MTDGPVPVEGVAPVEGVVPASDVDADLLGLIDRLAELLDRSDLTELEVESGGTGLVLRKADGADGGRRRRRRPAAGHAPDSQPAAGETPAPPPRAGRPGRPVDQGAADRDLLRLAGARQLRPTSRSAARSRSAR